MSQRGRAKDNDNASDDDERANCFFLPSALSFNPTPFLCPRHSCPLKKIGKALPEIAIASSGQEAHIGHNLPTMVPSLGPW